MTQNHHTAYPIGQELTAANQNAPLSSLDSAITNIIGTDDSNPLYRVGASSELTIASGAVTVTKSHHTIDTQGDVASDDLDTMTIATSNVFGVIRAENTARTVVVKHGTGNILTWDGSDIDLDDTNKSLLYYYDGTNVRIVSIIAAGGGGGGIGGSTGATDNAVLRANGTGGATLQNSGIIIDDSDNVTNINSIQFQADSELTISTGAVTKTGGVHTIDTESDAASDDLDTISGGTEGNILIISANNAARTVVIKHGTGNIETWDGNDISLDELRKKLIMHFDGTNWQVMSVIASGGGGGGSGAMVELVATTELGSPASSISLSAISASYQDLILRLRIRSSDSNFDDELYLRFNSDSSANYAYFNVVFDNAGIDSNVAVVSDTEMQIPTLGNSADADDYTEIVIRICNYTDITYDRKVSWSGIYFRIGTNVNHIRRYDGIGSWENVADAISSIQLTLGSAGNFMTGSSYALYGIGSA